MEPTRLMDGGDGFERELLSAARRDEPPYGAISRGAVALGLAVSSVSITATTAGSAGAAGAKAGSAVLGSLSIMKWMGIGAAVGLVTTSGAGLVSDPELLTSLVRRKPAEQPAPVRAVSKAHVAPQLPIEPRGVAEPGNGSNDGLAVAPPAPASSPKGRATPAAAADEDLVAESHPVPPAAQPPTTDPPPPSLAAELGALERARQALLLHRPNDVFGALDDYAAARKTTVLESEAELLRIEALLQAGQRETAVKQAKRALEQAPNGPHAARLREIANSLAQ